MDDDDGKLDIVSSKLQSIHCFTSVVFYTGTFDVWFRIKQLLS